MLPSKRKYTEVLYTFRDREKLDPTAIKFVILGDLRMGATFRFSTRMPFMEAEEQFAYMAKVRLKYKGDYVVLTGYFFEDTDHPFGKVKRPEDGKLIDFLIERDR